MRISTKVRVKIRQIKEVLEQEKGGIWISELARKVPFAKLRKYPEPAICYYLYGIKVKDKYYGGFFRNAIETVKIDGKNRFIKLKGKYLK